MDLISLRCCELLLEDLWLIIVDVILRTLYHLLLNDLRDLKRHSIDTLCLAFDIPLLLVGISWAKNAILHTFLIKVKVLLFDKVSHNLLFMLI